MHNTTKTLLIAGFVGIANSLSAQTCVGNASYAAGPMRVGAGMQMGDHAKSYGAEFGMGSAMGLFGSASLGRATYDGVDGGGTLAGLNGGYSFDLTPTKNVQFCPVAGFMHQSGPDIDVGIGSSAHAFALGGSFGGSVPMSPTLDFVPFAGAAYTNSTGTITQGNTSTSTSVDYTMVTLGAGFVMNHTFTIQPGFAIPVGLDNGKSSFQIALGYNFGGPHAAATTPARRR
jgi:hypothetical protein